MGWIFQQTMALIIGGYGLLMALDGGTADQPGIQLWEAWAKLPIL